MRALTSARLNSSGWTPLHAACYKGLFSTIKYLIEQMNADPNVQNDNGWHSLTFTVMGSSI
jgi:ankyrin repeat protein